MIPCWDPILRAPLFGVAFLSIAISLLGGWLLVQRRILVGEVLSHASYPGVMLAILFSGSNLSWAGLWGSALAFIMLALVLVHYMKYHARITEDAACTFVLSTLFGVGTLFASVIQSVHPLLFNQVPMYLYGQAATIRDHHMVIYMGFALLVVCYLVWAHYRLTVMSFDRLFAKTLHLSTSLVETSFWLLIGIAVALGMRSLGIILLSSLMIIPAASARQWTDRLSILLVIAAAIGWLSSLVGVYLSLYGLPTGPCVTCVALVIAAGSFLLAPKGVGWRWYRRTRFCIKIREENAIKQLWMGQHFVLQKWLTWLLLIRGWMTHNQMLTEKGRVEGARIVRLHRLWELYLVRSLHMGTNQVHTYAEQVEHVLTEEIENQLDRLLDFPQKDPHQQPIPSKEDRR